MTKEESLAVVSIACFISFRSSRRLAKARISAPAEPMAPPSVGVAMPRKMVPSTRKISARGGIMTMTTWRESRLKDVQLEILVGQRDGVG